jgi:hypothetical protein
MIRNSKENKELNASNQEIKKQNQNNLRILEEFYTTGKVEEMLTAIEEKKKELIKDMVNYADTHRIPCKWDEEGNPTAYKLNMNPLVINNYYFKSIVPVGSKEPMYNAEKLAMVWDYYCDLVAGVNEHIGYFPSSLTSFCKLAGLTLSTLKSYKNSNDLSMRIIAEKIYDQIGDDNITMAQLDMVKERSTIFKMKSQNEMVEKQQPNVNINITEKPDMEKIEERINKYKAFAIKKEAKNGRTRTKR